MTSHDRLLVWLGHAHAGDLWREAEGGMSFRYTSDYLASNGAAPLSLSLPLRAEAFTSKECRPFFANVLPDGALRQAVARKLGLSEDNDFGLLVALGGECAGAVSLLPVGQKPTQDGRYERLGPAQFEKLIEELPHRPLLAGERGIRLSLAGAQKKIPLRYDGESFFLALGAFATTHILKPEITQFKDSVRNEALSMSLAGRLGLPVPRCWIHRGAQPVYVVERFDRRVGLGGAVERLHAEDFCQATGRLPSQKYQAEGGPTFAECFDLVARRSANPQQDRHALLRIAVFNALLYNADAHGKNFSLLQDGSSVRLAPFYDLLSTRVYKGIETDLAMWIGDKRNANELKRQHWERFADHIQVGRREVFAALGDYSRDMPGLAAKIAAEQDAVMGPSATIRILLGGIGHRCRLAIQQAKAPNRGR